jgi:hypothetical protein
MTSPENFSNQPESQKGMAERELADMYAKGSEDATKVLEGLETYGKFSGDLDTITNEQSYLKGFAETLMAEARRELEVEEELDIEEIEEK